MIERVEGRLRVTAPMTIPNADGLLEAGRSAFRGPQETVDLAAVTEVDSAALAVLLGWLRAAGAAGLTLSVINAPAGLLALADLYGLDELIPFA